MKDKEPKILVLRGSFQFHSLHYLASAYSLFAIIQSEWEEQILHVSLSKQ